MEIDVPVHFPSKYVLEHMTRRMGFLDEAHSGVGEKYGVRRTWISEELGSDNVVTLCDEAWAKIGDVLAKAHAFLGLEAAGPPPHGHDPSRVDLLTETDVDPTLPTGVGPSSTFVCVAASRARSDRVTSAAGSSDQLIRMVRVRHGIAGGWSVAGVVDSQDYRRAVRRTVRVLEV